jgi:hypothetical protein
VPEANVRQIARTDPILPGDLSFVEGNVRAIFADVKHVRDRAWSCMPLTNLLVRAGGVIMQRWIYSDTGGSTWRP